jgi:hypothetical protein
MKLIIAGSRTINSMDVLCRAFGKFSDKFVGLDIIVSGHQPKGVDALGEKFAEDFDLDIKTFPPDYDNYPPKVAPLMRNKQMAHYADKALIVWDGISTGSKNMEWNMKQLRKPVFVYKVEIIKAFDDSNRVFYQLPTGEILE